MNTTIYIIRHGESEANIKKLYGLNTDYGLTDKGRQQIQELSQKFKGMDIAAVYTSDLIRAKQTAEILAKERDLAVITKEALRERSYGRLNGKTVDQMREELQEIYEAYETMGNKDKYYFKLVDDMETVDEVVGRFLTILREIAVAYEGKNVIVVSHVTLMRGLLIHLGYVDHDQIDGRLIDNAAYIKLEGDGVDFFVKETSGIYTKQ